MMEITCDQCGKKYRIDETKIPTRKAKFSCKTCDHVMIVEKAEPEADDQAAPPDLPQMDDTVEARMDDTQSDAQPLEKAPEPSVPAPEEDTGPRRISVLNSIQFRISALLVVLTFIIMAVYAWINYRDLKANMETEITDSSEIITKRLSRHLVEPFYALDDEMLTGLLETEMEDPQIFAIHIYDRDGRTIYMGKKRNAAWRLIDSSKSVGGAYQTGRKTISKGKDNIGSVEVYLTTKFMEERFRSSMRKIYITAAALVIILFITLFLALRKMIIVPISKLTEVAEQVSMGDLDAQISTASKNEIGLLAQAIGRMQTSLRFAMQRLQSRR